MTLADSAGRFTKAFRNRDYAIYCAGSTITLIGLWMQRIAAGWVMWEMTESATWLGLVAFADLFPVMVVSPIAGTMADRIDRLWIAKVTQVLAMLQAIALAWLTLSGGLTPYTLMILVLFSGAVMSFWQPARMSLIPNLVRREDLASAVAINSVLFNCARFIGPAIAGWVIVAWGAGYAFAANAATYVVFLIALMMISAPHIKRDRERRPFHHDILDGYRYAARHPGIGPILILVTIICIFMRPVFELLPGFAAQVFERGAEGLSMLAAATGAGAIISGIFIGQRAGVEGLTRVVIFNVALMAASLTLFVATDIFWVGLVTLAVAGGAMVASGAGTQTLVQHSVEESMRGRVMALYGMLFRGCPAIGALAFGWIAETQGLRLPLLFGAGIGLCAWIWVMRRRQQIGAALEQGRG
jgi:predicted MFS family arabinose efflux permease